VADKDRIINTYTIQPDDPAIKYASPKRNLSKTERGLIEVDVMNTMQAAISARAAFDRNLDDWDKLYEMQLDPVNNEPWPDASNVFIPIIPSQLDTSQAYIVVRTLVPRFIIVSGNTPEAQDSAYLVERYYNAELVRQRGSETWYQELESWLKKSFHGGVAVMEALWVRKKTKRMVRMKQPMMHEDVPVINEDTGEPRYEYIERQITETLIDDVRLKALKAKDFGVVPVSSETINTAIAVWRKEWFYESELLEMCVPNEDGVPTLWRDVVDDILAYVEDGATDDVTSDRQGDYDKSAARQLELGMAQGSNTSKFFKNRGPVLIYRVHSRQYDMDGDGIPEENIFYYHDKSQRLVGWMPYDYPNPHERPFFTFAWCPRNDQFPGISFIERLTALNAQINKENNDRNNAIDIRLTPPLFLPSGTELYNSKGQWGPGVMYEGTSKPEFLNLGEMTMYSVEAETMHNQYVTQITGNGLPQMGSQSSGKRTATENKQQAQATGTRNDLVAVRFRIACRALFNFIHRLKVNFLPNNTSTTFGDTSGKTFVLPTEVLELDYRIDISGATDPVDAQSRLNQDMGIYQMVMQAPLVQMDPMKQYAFLRKVLEAAGYTDIDKLIGTEQDMMKQMQAMQAQQAQQQQAAAAVGGQPPNGKPQQPQHATK